MAQGRQQNNGSRQRCAQSAAAKAPAEPPKAVCAQLEQMNRKLAAASAEILRYQTRLFACERQEAECASAHAEQLRQELARHAEAVRPVPVAAHTPPQPEPSAAQSQRPEPEAEQPPQPGPEAPQPAQPDWKPQTRLEHLSVELMNWFDDMMGA